MAEKPEAVSQRQGTKAQGAEMGGNVHTRFGPAYTQTFKLVLLTS